MCEQYGMSHSVVDLFRSGIGLFRKFSDPVLLVITKKKVIV
jgi:hypothetical protein